MSLDPKDWNAFRKSAHAMLDASLDKMEASREGRVWTQVPDNIIQDIAADLPLDGISPDAMQAELEAILPYGPGNTHPRFFGWVNGAGSPSNLLADIAASSMNVNAGGRNHVAPYIERRVIRWAAQVMDMPETTSGRLVTGTSMATIVALKVARDLAHKTKAKNSPLVGYTSDQTHSSVKRAFDLLGIGTDAVREIPCNDDFQMHTPALQAAINEDIKSRKTPFAIIGNAGAVNTGAIDDLDALADIAKDNGLWFHIDGAFGAAAMLSKTAKVRLKGLSRADSLAFDFHKWWQVNYESGCVLIRDEAAHRQAFAARPEYLRGSERGLAGGSYWPVDYGPELSQSFRALKVWTHLKSHGTHELAAVIDRNIEQAKYLETLVKASPKLEMLAPVPLNICCFRYKFKNDTNAKNAQLVVLLQESGIAAPSTTTLGYDLAIRVNITNHRTEQKDLDILVEAIIDIGNAL